MKKYFSSILFLLAAMIWGLAFTAQKQASSLGAFTVGASRNAFATLFLIIIIPMMDKITANGRHMIVNRRPDITKYELLGGIAAGAVLTFASFTQQTGISDGTDAGKAAFITTLYVAIVPIIALLRKRSSPINVWISVGVAVVGFYILCVNEGFSIAASDLMILLCSFIFAMHITVVDHFSPKCDGVRMAAIQCLTAFCLNTLLALIMESPIPFAEIGSLIAPLLLLGIGSSGIAYTLQIVGQKWANPAVAGIIMSLESVFGVLFAALIEGEVMTPREYLGCAVVFVAVILSQISFKPRKSKV